MAWLTTTLDGRTITVEFDEIDIQRFYLGDCCGYEIWNSDILHNDYRLKVYMLIRKQRKQNRLK